MTTAHSCNRAAHAWVSRVVLQLAMLLIASASFAQAPERRVALVIGVGAYQGAPALAHPVKDARTTGEALRRLNFEVDEILDPDFRALSRGIRAFGIKAQKADVAVVYYAGHGVQVGRENYLLPADTRLERERDLLYEAVPLELLLGEVSQSAKLGIVLLDACRDNPFSARMTRSVTPASRGIGSSGLARVDNVPRNTVVVMATKPDHVAEDGVGEHSPFAAVLQAHFAMPGLELNPFFRSVRESVLRQTNNRQEPYVLGFLGAEQPFYFLPRPSNRPPVLGVMGALEVRDTAGPTSLGITAPTDPDQDPMTVRVTGLPRFGEVLVQGRPIRPGMVFPSDRIASATYKPEPGRTGPAGTFDLLVEDGRGGNATGSVAVSVVPSNRPPVAEAPRRIRIYTGALEVSRPTDPDGDPLTVVITALPRGLIRNGAATLRVGDRLRPELLAGLVFVPDAGFTGLAGALAYQVEDGRDGVAQSALELDVMSAAEAASEMAEFNLWGRLRGTSRAEDLDAFTRFYPNSRFAPAVAQRRAELAGRTEPPAVQAARPAPATPASPERLALLQPPRVVSDTPRALSTEPAEAGTVQDCPTCPAMIRVPAGSFIMGQGAKDPAALPVRRVAIPAFMLAQQPVTIGNWQACRAGGGCTDAMPRLATTENAAPMHNISWDDAQQYIAWLSRTSGQAYRLPSEAEWEYAARAGTTTRYWWGEQPGVAQANCTDCGGTQDARVPASVRSYQPNTFGLYGMSGGVSQWVQDCWAPNYTNAPIDGGAREVPACPQRVLRGGSFKSSRDDITVAARGYYDAPVRYFTNGFRVARAN